MYKIIYTQKNTNRFAWKFKLNVIEFDYCKKKMLKLQKYCNIYKFCKSSLNYNKI